MSDAWDGRPERPEVDGWHWLHHKSDSPRPFHWDGDQWQFPSHSYGPRDVAAWGYTYLGPVPDAAAVQAERAAAAEAMRETCAKWHDERGLAAMPGTGGLARHQWLSECIRGLPLPDTSALDAAIKAAEARGIERAVQAVRTAPYDLIRSGPATDAEAAIRASIEEVKGNGK